MWRIELFLASLLTCSIISKFTWKLRCPFLVKIDHKIWKLFKGLNVPHGRFHPHEPFFWKDGCSCKWNHYHSIFLCVNMRNNIPLHLPLTLGMRIWIYSRQSMKMLWDSKNNNFNLVLGWGSSWNRKTLRLKMHALTSITNVLKIHVQPMNVFHKLNAAQMQNPCKQKTPMFKRHFLGNESVN